MRLEFAHKFALSFFFVASLSLGLPTLLEGFGVPAILAGSLTLLVSTGIGLLLAKQITRNVRLLRACTDRISKGDLNVEVELVGGQIFPDETLDLSESIDQMLKSLCELVGHIQHAADQVKKSSEELTISSHGVKDSSY